MEPEGWCTLDSELSESELIKSVLVAGLEDWVDPGLIYHLTEYLDAEPCDRRLITFAAMVQMVVLGLVIPGETRDGGFVPWPNGSADRVDRLVHEFLAAGPVLRPGDVAWLENTAAGDKIARTVSGG